LVGGTGDTDQVAADPVHLHTQTYVRSIDHLRRGDGDPDMRDDAGAGAEEHQIASQWRLPRYHRASVELVLSHPR
jgi:hypothetical protein